MSTLHALCIWSASIVRLILTLLTCAQASFNRPGAVGAPVGGHGSRASGIDWATLKNEDKALVDQVLVTPYCLSCSHDCCSLSHDHLYSSCG